MVEFVPTDRELDALKVLWARGPSTVREIGDAMNQQGAELAYTTVLSLLQVMEQKAMVGHRRSGKAYVYFAKIERDSTFRKLAGGFLEKVFDGALEEYLVHALRSHNPNAAELDRLEKMIVEARGRSRRHDKQGTQS
jgi:BlaI family transcriptional regulator, penicillinase repressor